MSSALLQVSRPDAPWRSLLRLIIGALTAAVITLLLYWLMSALVAAGRNALTEAPKGRIVDFVRVPEPPQLRTEQPKPEKPPKPEIAPETPQVQSETVKPSGNTVNIGSLSVDSELAVDTSAGLSASDGEYLPIVKVAPQYPRRAQTRGIEGWVLLSFTVTETGAVVDPVVLDAEPAGVFEDAASKAVVRFKYKPRVINGQAQQVTGVEHLITFELDD
ncbi:MAG: TonB family protein [Pseudomonadota bacterium]|nr:TonB family protein [Pseudomonadota bacterium]